MREYLPLWASQYVEAGYEKTQADETNRKWWHRADVRLPQNHPLMRIGLLNSAQA